MARQIGFVGVEPLMTEGKAAIQRGEAASYDSLADC